MKYLGCLLVAVLMAACGSDGADGPREWPTSGDVAVETCAILCDWAAECGQDVPECPVQCLTDICDEVECAGEPPGSDGQIDRCLDAARAHGPEACGDALGIPQECQDSFWPRPPLGR